ncbi:MAG: transporter substrate-binding domain-containing protein [Moraxellaceae bacterium]|nr:transporter substrate-binding domain-containing protein [Moraxellaceae bacterium]
MRSRSVLKLSSLAVAAVLASSIAQATPDNLLSPADSALPPFSMSDLGGGMKGLTIDLAAELSKQIGQKLNIDPASWSAALPGLASGKYDLLLAPVNVTPERAAMLLFSEPYLENDFLFLVKKDAPAITDPVGFKGKTIAVNKGSSFEAWVKSKAEELDLKVDTYGSGADAIQAVQSGRAFGTLSSLQAAEWIGANNPQLKTSYRVRTGAVAAIAFPKNNPELQLRVSNALKCLKMNGVLPAIYEKWTGAKLAPTSPTVVVYEGIGVKGFEGYKPDAPKPVCK